MSCFFYKKLVLTKMFVKLFNVSIQFEKLLLYNGSRLGEVGDLESQSLNFSTNFK